MILAAGLGTRMRPLTDKLPKPLLPVGDSSLIEHHLYKLAEAGIEEVVINVSYLAEKIEAHLGSGEPYGLKITYSRESEPLETAGGIQKALPFLAKEGLADETFLLVNGDVYTDFPFSSLIKRGLHKEELAHLVLVQNPDHHPEGDFSIGAQGELCEPEKESFTYSGLSLLSTAPFKAHLESNRLVELFHQLIAEQENSEQILISAQTYQDLWVDVGTPERLEQLKVQLRDS
jgi:MurNAc alpha-1-phosphate uridylyltransferase